jgi:hypothetical protein
VTALRCAGSSVYSASSDKTVVCWDAASRSPLYVQCDHSSYVKALLLCNWQLWSLSKDSLHVTVADGLFSGLHQQLDLSQIQTRSMSAALASQKSQIEDLQFKIQASHSVLPMLHYYLANMVHPKCFCFIFLFSIVYNRA